jgi:DNA mismatch repair protein MutS2
MATTHYSELKAYALSTPGVENASVEFDIETLRPTYRLSIGVPGKSNAFEISRKLGLSEALIDEARTLLSGENIRFEDVIANAEYHRQVAEKERLLAEEASKETVRLRDEAERLRKEMESRRENTLRKSREEARRVLEDARREADALIADLKRMKKEQSAPDASLQEARRRMDASIDALAEGLRQEVDNGQAPKTVKPGDEVDILTLGSPGTVLSLPNEKGEVQVQAGIMKVWVSLSQLRLRQTKKKEKPRTTIHNPGVALTQTVHMDCDVRGMDLAEALGAVDKYLDQAHLAGLGEVTIIHGKGTGVLRSGIQQALRKHPFVKSYRRGVYGEGEDGVTVVTLK